MEPIATPCLGRRASQEDEELEKLKRAGLVPFYWGSSNELVRHKIGGPGAAQMRHQVFSATLSHDGSSSDDGGFAEGDPLGGLWDVYPSGISPGFLANLDTDVWAGRHAPSDQSKSQKRRRAAARRRGKTASGRPLCPALLPPSNAERRAQVREEARQALAAEAERAKHVADEKPHPLLVNLPLQPKAPSVSLTEVRVWGQWPRRRPTGSTQEEEDMMEDEEECSWGDATSSFDVPRMQQHLQLKCLEEKGSVHDRLFNSAKSRSEARRAEWEKYSNDQEQYIQQHVAVTSLLHGTFDVSHRVVYG